MSMKLEALGERKFKIKLKSKTEDYVGSKVQNPVPLGCNKRKREPKVEEQPSKKWKMDPTVKRQSRGMLDALLAHRHSRVFNCPVDPVALKIPDYLTVITHPMDLGTIKSKLTTNAYRDTEEFAADVKLTFSNAMLYNPPDHPVHSMAKELETLFLKRWKLLEAKWNHGIVSAPQAYGDQRIGLDAGKTCSSISAPFGLPVRASKPRMSVDEKKKLKKDLTEILVGRMAEKLKIEFSKLGIEIPRKEIIDQEFDRFGEDVLWQLKKVVEDNGCRFLSKSNINSGGSVGAFDGKSKSSLLCHGATAKSVVSNGDTDLQKALIAARNVKMTVSESVDKPSPNRKSKSSLLSKSVVSNEETDLQKALNAARSAKMNKSNQNSGGSVGALDGKSKSSHLSHGATAKSVLLNEETDLQKALNAARLVKMKKKSSAKVNCDSEFGKAQEARTHNPGMVQLEATANSEKALADSRTEERNALATLEEKSKRIADEDKVGSYNELVKLSGCSISFDSYYGVVLRLRELKTGKVVDPLANIGLHLKKDFIADVSDYDDYVSDVEKEVEEGEILQ